MRTVGVEEELLLVDGSTGRPRSVASQVLALADDEGAAPDGSPGGELQHELQEQQLETGTTPHVRMSELEDEVRLWRRNAAGAARRAGARVIATGTSPFPVEPQLTQNMRFAQMATRFGLTTSEQLTCGCHVHVAVTSLDEAVAVMDRIRGWLPVLLALSSNSPFWQGQDSGYASFRSQAMTRWPVSGPVEIFGSAAGYRAHVESLLGMDVLLDEAMIYSDVRPSHTYPTLEIRVADVCLDARDTTLVAALCRGLVETAARDWQRGVPAPALSTALLRLASWQAARYGVTGKLFDPSEAGPVAAEVAVTRLVEHVTDALRDTDDLAMVQDRTQHLVSAGTGAARQQATWAKTGNLLDVVADLATATVTDDGG